MSLPESYVSIRGLSFSRGERMIFNDLSVEFPRGKVTAIMGPSGTGKTTLLRSIGGQLLPDAGEVVVAGGGKYSAIIPHRAAGNAPGKMGMLFQTGGVIYRSQRV